MRSGKLLFLAITAYGALAADTSQAQTVPKAFEDISAVSPLLRKLHMPFTEKAHIVIQPKKAAHSTAKTTAVQSRLYASSHYNSDGISFNIQDSSHYSFSPDRGGDLRTAIIKFDEEHDYAYDASSMGFLNSSKYLQTFDANNVLLNKIEQLWNTATADWVNNNKFSLTSSSTGKPLVEAYQTWNSAGSAWENTQQYIYSYDPSTDQLMNVIQQNWDITTGSWLNNWRYTNTYDASGNTVTVLTQNWDAPTSSWLDGYREIRTYNSKNKITNILTAYFNTATITWENSNQGIYQYDPSGLLLLVEAMQAWDATGSVWLNLSKNVHSYTSSGQIAAIVSQVWSNPSWVNQYKQNYTYDLADNNTGYTYQIWNGSAWENRQQILRDYDSRHNNTAEVYSDWNSSSLKWDSGTRYQMSYNSNDQKTRSSSDQWNPGGFWEQTLSDNQYNYYYEEYTTGLNNMAVQGASLQLYPVPAGTELHIALRLQQAQSFTVTIYDLQGRTWQSWQQPATTTYNTVMNTGGLPSGNYLIRFKGDKNAKATQQFSVIR